MWELIQITSQLGIKDSHAVHTVILALQEKFCRNSWNKSVQSFQLLLSKAKALCNIDSSRTARGHFCQRCVGPRKAQAAAGKKAKNFCQCKPVLKAIRATTDSTACGPRSSLQFGEHQFPLSEPHKKYLRTSTFYIQSSISTTAPNASYQATTSTQETFSEMGNKQLI